VKNSPIVFEVLNLNDSGPGSLRQAIADASLQPGSTIVFKPGLNGTIALAGTQLVINVSMEVNGPGRDKIAISGSGLSRVLYASQYGTGPIADITISGLTIKDGLVHDGAAGISNANARLTLNDCDIKDNQSIGSSAGGIFSAFPLVMNRCNVTGNVADGSGGGLNLRNFAGAGVFTHQLNDCNISDNSAGTYAGGLAVRLYNGACEVERCTISGNDAKAAAGMSAFLYFGPAQLAMKDCTVSDNVANGVSAGSFAGAGGIAVYQADPAVGVDFEQCTISGNQATHAGAGSGDGGGININTHAGDVAPVTLSLCTVANNQAAHDGGGFHIRPGANVSIRNSIVGTNAAPAGPDIHGAVSADYSLIQDTTDATITGAHNVTGSDPQLGALADNGGPTKTQLPADTSPAIDAGDPAFTPPPATDQRGLPRVVVALDMGSVERQ